MKVFRMLVISTFAAIALTSSPQFFARSAARAQSQEKPKTTAAPNPRFRYVIVFEGSLHNGRLVQVLIDPKSFNKANLIELVGLISKRFPKPDELHVGVFTSLEQLPTPEETDYASSAPEDWEPSYISQIEKYPGAVYARVDGNEGFKYSMVDGKPQTIVVLKGKNPFSN